jgi:membrane protease YdiL (CAAX protease family)
LKKYKKMDFRKIVLFLLFAFGISWLSAGVMLLLNIPYGSTLSIIIVAIAYMGAPAIAALLVQKVFYKQEITALGFDFKNTSWKNFLLLPLLHIHISVLFILVVFVFGNMLHVNGFGFYSFDQQLLEIRMQEFALKMGMEKIPNIPLSPMILLVLSLLSSALFGGVINGIFTLGEELGWRGFLYNETKALGFVKSNLLVGAIWGLWHAPLILQGHNYPEHPVAGVGMMVIFCIPLAFIMSYARAKTNSVLAPALVHGMVNAGAGGTMLLCYQYNDLIGNIAGLGGAIAISILVVLLFVFDRKTIDRF